MENENLSDPYAVVLADLRAQKLKIEQAIEAIESLRGGLSPTTPSQPSSTSTQPKQVSDGPGAFLGMSIPDAAKKLLNAKRQPMRTPEIAAELERGGLHLTSADKVNTIGSVLLRRFNTVGDVVRVQRGVWGLAEWYPGRRFNKSATVKGEDSTKEDENENTDIQAVDETGTQPVAGTAPWTQKTVDDILG